MGCSSSAAVHPAEKDTIKLLREDGFLVSKSSIDQLNTCRPNRWNRALIEAPMHSVGKSGNLESAQWLVERGADVCVLNSFAQTPLMLACERGHLSLAAFLLEHTKKRNQGVVESSNLVLSASSYGGLTPLHLVAARGRREACAWVLRELGNFHEELEVASKFQHAATATKDCHGDTPLLLACLAGDTDTCRTLFEFSGLWPGPHVHLSRNRTEVPRWVAAALTQAESRSKPAHDQFIHPETSEVGLSSKNSLQAETARMMVAEADSWVAETYSRRADYLAKHSNKDGTTLLHAACLGGNPAVVRWVLSKLIFSPGVRDDLAGQTGDAPNEDVDPNVRAFLHTQDNAGERPLLVASHWGHAGSCAELIISGALVRSLGVCDSHDSLPLTDEDLFEQDLAKPHPTRSAVEGSAEIDSSDPAGLPLLDPFDPQAAGARGNRPRPLGPGSGAAPGAKQKRVSESPLELEALRLAGEESQRAAAPVDVRAWLQEWAEAELQRAASFPACFLVGTLKVPKSKTKHRASSSSSFRGDTGGTREDKGDYGAARAEAVCILSLLRKTDRRVRDRPRQLIADFSGVLYGRRRRLARELLDLLNQRLGKRETAVQRPPL